MPCMLKYMKYSNKVLCSVNSSFKGKKEEYDFTKRIIEKGQFITYEND